MIFQLMFKNNIIEAINDLEKIKNSYKECLNCFYIMENDFCFSCMDKKRNSNKICVVTHPIDAYFLMQKEVFDGVFHILKGEIDLTKNISPDYLTIKNLFGRINKEKDTEVIFALNSTFKGELTTNYIIKVLESKKIKYSRLARGIPFGADLSYTDKETLKSALENRK